MRPGSASGAAALAVALGAAGCGSEVDDRPVRWSYIATTIIEPNCATAGCHSKTTRTAGLELETREGSYQLLVGSAGSYVVPGDPVRSMLMYLLRGQDTWRMPPDQPLPDADIELIERWILAGAKDD